MGRSRTYTDKFRASAVLMVEAAGYPNTYGAMERVAREQKIPAQTLEGWVKKGIRYGAHEEEVKELVEETRQELSDLLDNTIRAAIKSLPDKIDDASYRDTAISIAVFIDKLQLLNDKPTQNVQQAITFERRGISTLPEHLAPVTIEGIEGSETV